MATFRDQPMPGFEHDEPFPVRVESQAGGGRALACTAVHAQRFDRRIGGVRFIAAPAPQDRRELAELSSAMTWKCALAGLPADGEKTVVYCADGVPAPTEQAALMAEHLAELQAADPGVIFGPDMNCDEDVMELIAHAHGGGDHVSGLPSGRGGLSIDGRGYTAAGLDAALDAAAAVLGWQLRGLRASVQGFGAVGAHVARLLTRRGVAIHTVSTADGALVATTDAGLPIELLYAAWAAPHAPSERDAAFLRHRDQPPAGTRWADLRAVFEQPTDIFIPAARTDVLSTRDEQDQARAAGRRTAEDMQTFLERTGARVVLEGANHPLTDAAERLAEQRGVYVLPDYLVNCGGLLGCWADWVYRRELEGSEGARWSEDLNRRVPRLVARVVADNVRRLLEHTAGRPAGLRRAAAQVARRRRDELAVEYAAMQAPASAASATERARAKARAFMDAQLA